ncbi:hypothetical protein A5641_25675 [Mycobacterium sp. 1554424.7]|nr:hypothetical protein A5641_25675 [Mycobacterium sp. 1554424.7]
MSGDAVIRGDHALVAGGSMAGLVAARVLAKHYRQVTVVDRDVLPDGPINRRGVPQGRFSHILLGGGLEILDELFPRFFGDLVDAGVPSWREGELSRLRLWILGREITASPLPPTTHRPMRMCFASRPMLEWAVRRRVCTIPNVRVLQSATVVDLNVSETGDRIIGARVRTADGEATLGADVVVDATGRGSRMPVLLDELGYGRPVEDELKVHFVYRALPVQLPVEDTRSVIVNPKPGRPRFMGLVGYEHGKWLFTVGGMAGHEPPDNLADMISYAADFTPPDVLDALSVAKPLDDVATYRVPSNRWRRYDKMRFFPESLLVFGDAICSFNPIYGQGMTVAAKEALVLDRCLRRGSENLPRRFFRASAHPVRLAWQLSVGSDLSLPEVAGARPLSMRVTNAYMERVIAAAATDPGVAHRLVRVVGMVDPPLRLLHPSVIMRAALGGQ